MIKLFCACSARTSPFTEIIEKILKHLGLWELKARPPPKATGKTQEYHLDDSTSQLPASDKWLYVDPEPACAWPHADRYPEACSFDLEALDRPV